MLHFLLYVFYISISFKYTSLSIVIFHPWSLLCQAALIPIKFYFTILCFLPSLYWSLPWMCWHVHKVAFALFLDIFLSESSCDTSHHAASFPPDLLSSVTSAFAILSGIFFPLPKNQCSGQGLSCQTHSFQSLWSSSRPVGILLQLIKVVGWFFPPLKLGKLTAVWFPWLSQVEVICKDLRLLVTLISPCNHLLYAF